jgi:hypothetical protein
MHHRSQIAPAPAPQHPPKQAQKTMRPESTKLLTVLPTCHPLPHARNSEKAQTAKSILPSRVAVGFLVSISACQYAPAFGCRLSALRLVNFRFRSLPNPREPSFVYNANCRFSALCQASFCEVSRDTRASSSSVCRKRISTFPPLFRPFTLTGNSRASRMRREAW